MRLTISCEAGSLPSKLDYGAACARQRTADVMLRAEGVELSFTIIAQILFNVVVLAGMGILFLKIFRPQKDDPKISKALQLLQSKIAVLEDLSDRTEKQVGDMCKLLDLKIKDVHQLISEVESQGNKLQQSMAKSAELANIFEDKIPHEEIIERKNSKKYIEAAILANKGVAADEIARQVDLSIAEIHMIQKLNKERLMFNADELPAWANPTNQASAKEIHKDFSSVFESGLNDGANSLNELGKKFRQAMSSSESITPIKLEDASLSTILAEHDDNDDVQWFSQDVMANFEEKQAQAQKIIETAREKQSGASFDLETNGYNKSAVLSDIATTPYAYASASVSTDTAADNKFSNLTNGVEEQDFDFEAKFAELSFQDFSSNKAETKSETKTLEQASVANTLKNTTSANSFSTSMTGSTSDNKSEIAQANLAAKTASSKPATQNIRHFITKTADVVPVKKVIFPRIDSSDLVN